MTVVSPVDGGCWFCYTDDEGPWFFDVEWDTYVHERCLRAVLKEDPENPEANFMRYLLEDE